MSNKVSDFFPRVEYIVDTYYDGNQSEFCRKTGISRQYLNKMKRQSEGEAKGSPNPTLEVLQKIIINTGVNPMWLLTGEGEPDGEVFNRLTRKEAAHNDLLDELKSSDITEDEKIEFVSTQLERILRILRNDSDE